jgi:hypothetical protein
MSSKGLVHRLLGAEHQCRVIVEVAELGADEWRRLATDPRLTEEPRLSWRRVGAGRPVGNGQNGIPSMPRRRRTRVRADLPSPVRTESPTTILLEATGSSAGPPSVAKQRVAERAVAALRAAGLRADPVGATEIDEDPATAVPDGAADTVWPASDDVLVFGPSDRSELERRYEVLAAAWSLDPYPARSPDTAVPPAPELSAPARARRRAVRDSGAVLCTLPLLLMIVPTLGPWWDGRTWLLFLAVALLCLALPLLALQALSHRAPGLVTVRNRALVLAAVLLVLLLLARALVAVPLPPAVPMVAALAVVVVGTPLALRWLPTAGPGTASPSARAAVLAGLPVLLAVLAAPVGDMLDGVYLSRLGLRATDVTLTFAQRWWSGAYFAVLALAAVALAATAWGLWCQLDASGRRQRLPTGPVLALCGAVAVGALLAASAAGARNRAMAGPGELPGAWGGIHPVWVCWTAPPGGPVPFAGPRLPPTATAVGWLGSTPGRLALWSPASGGVLVSDQVQLRVRDGAGPC